MDKKIFIQFRDIIYAAAGISLNEKKEALVSARIAKRMRALGMEEHEEYLQYVQNDKNGEEIVQLLDAVSTNVTHFFRENEHFDFLSEAMSQWLEQGQRRFRYWSAGCSSGEEPYSIAMTLLQTLDGRTSDMRILATDISTRILAASMAGEYSARKIENVSPFLRERYFVKQGRNTTAVYRVKDQLKKMILFKRLNLSVVPFPMQGPMDTIFCRNVMIYFDNEVRKRLLNEFYRLLKPGGYLMVGHAESLTGMLSGFKCVKPSVYVKA
ncbi:MAG: methyltransferase domain-containing protein [Chitinivibrionales bacterium]|nr:methyltransferase domain-containing protein [Chitinivibrionales bacterium]